MPKDLNPIESNSKLMLIYKVKDFYLLLTEARLKKPSSKVSMEARKGSKPFSATLDLAVS